MYAWKDRWMDGTKEQTTEWIEHRKMDRWMDRVIEQWTGGWNKRTNIRMDETDRAMDGWMDQWMGGWNDNDEWMEQHNDG